MQHHTKVCSGRIYPSRHLPCTVCSSVPDISDLCIKQDLVTAA